MSASRAASLATAACALLMVTFLAAAPGRAQDDMRDKGNRFCSGDARRLCKELLGQGDMIVLQCFQENKARLSAPCRKFLTEIGQL